MACCNDFSRSQLLRSVGRQGRTGAAGDRVRHAEPGRHRITRRSMLLGSAGHVPDRLRRRQDGLDAFETGIAEAFSGPAQPVVVSIFLPGGMDGISVLAPVYDPNYQTLRTTTKMDEAGTLAGERPHEPALASRRRRRSRTCTTRAR